MFDRLKALKRVKVIGSALNFGTALFGHCRDKPEGAVLISLLEEVEQFGFASQVVQGR